MKADIVEVISRYTDLVLTGNGTLKAVINPIREENTSSLFLYPATQSWYDYGSGIGGDCIAFIQAVEGVGYKEAVSILSSGNYTATLLHSEPQPKRVQIPTAQIFKEFNSFIPFEDIKGFNGWKLNAKQELQSTVEFYLLQQASKEDLAELHEVIRYDKKNDTLVMLWANGATYKRRGYKEGKWVNRAGTHPNNSLFIRIKENAQRIYIVEGAHDCLTAIAMGLSFIGIPTTSYKNKEALWAGIGDREAIFICEDLVGYQAMKHLSEGKSNARLLTFTTDPGMKVDLSDYAATKEGLKEALNGLEYR